jgi:hypothetical protein
MLERLSTRLNLALSRHSMSLVETAGWVRPRGKVIGLHVSQAECSGLAHVGDGLGELLNKSGQKGRPVHVLVADELVRFWMVEPPKNATRLADYEAAAAMRFQTLFDEPADDWQISASIDVGGAYLACAVPRALLDQVIQALARRQMPLASMAPEFVALWNCWRRDLKSGAWLGVWRGNSLSLGISRGNALGAVRQMAVPVEAAQDAGWIHTQVLREALRLDVPMPSRLSMCGEPPRAWVSGSTTPLACSVLGRQNDALTLFGVRA